MTDPFQVINGFVDAARRVFDADLISVVLYGSAAEDQLRPTSDVNVLVLLSAFDPAKGAAIRDAYALAEAAVHLNAMFVLESELPAAVESFAQKFSDIHRRRRVLHGPDPFANVSIPRSALVLRLKQVLLNLALRLREAYVERGSTPEQFSALIADSAGPLRSSAAALLELEGKPGVSPKESLQSVAACFSDPGWNETLAHVSEARNRQLLAPEAAEATVVRLIDLATRLRARVDALE